MKSEYLVRLTIDDNEDWFLLQTPKRSNNGKQITNVVQCPHNSTLLKTKNLYLTYDDETGIGTIQYLVNRALQNTGWTLGVCDTFYEADGTTEKVRSLKSEGKVGTYQLITNICNLFQAYPTYHGDTKTVDIHELKNKLPVEEMWIGKNLKTLAVDNNSSNLITRLYVEGDYGEFGYVGIDDVNPTGLSYILNFDYYRQIGVFTAAHETAYNTYMTDMPAKVAAIKTKSSQIATLEDTQNTAWGPSNYVLYKLSSGQITKTIVGGSVKDENKVVRANDHFAVFKATGNYREVVASAQGTITWASNDTLAIKFLPSVNSTVGSLQVNSGQIGAKQVAIEAKQKLITSLQHDYDIETDPLKKASIAEQISGLQTDIQTIYNGNADTTGLYSAMRTAVNNAVTLDTRLGELSTLQTQQLAIEAAFSTAMGDMLRDGYWADNNYAPGQEASLYADALAIMEQLSKPQVNISVSLGYLADEMGYHEDTPQINTKIHLIDDDLNVDDVAYISKRTLYLSDPRKDSVDIVTADVALSGRSFDSVMSRISQLADLLDQRSTLYDRSQAINGNGSIYMDRLAGAMNVMKNQITSSVSNWYTDDNGAQIFEAVDGSSAMMLTGEGFMIADGKTQDGEWNWRTFGTGKGFTADAIITGYLSADRIEAGTISVSKVTQDFGTYLDIANNGSITSIVNTQVRVFTQWDDPANTADNHVKDGDIWIQDNNIRTWGTPGSGATDTQAAYYTWNGLSPYPWESFLGTKSFVRKDGEWVVLADMSAVVQQETKIEQNAQNIRLTADSLAVTNETVAQNHAEFVVTSVEISGRVDNAEGEMAQISLSVDGLSTEVDDARGGAASLDVRLNGIDSEISNVKTNIETNYATKDYVAQTYKSDVIYYLATPLSSGVTTDTQGWSTNPQQHPITATNKYLWIYHTYTYTDGHTANTTPSIAGVYGDKGDPGTSGVGISSVTEYYAINNSSSNPPSDASFSIDVVSPTASDRYLWNYEIITKTDNSTQSTDKRVIGVYGENGTGITGVKNYYLATSASSGVTRGSSGWTTAVQTTDNTKRYLWNYEEISYSSGNPTYTDPCIIGTYGQKGDTGATGKGITSAVSIYLVK